MSGGLAQATWESDVIVFDCCLVRARGLGRCLDAHDDGFRTL